MPKRLSSALLPGSSARERVSGHVLGISSCKHRLTIPGSIWKRSLRGGWRDACHSGAMGSHISPPIPLNISPVLFSRIPRKYIQICQQGLQPGKHSWSSRSLTELLASLGWLMDAMLRNFKTTANKSSTY